MRECSRFDIPVSARKWRSGEKKKSMLLQPQSETGQATSFLSFSSPHTNTHGCPLISLELAVLNVPAV